MFQLLHPLFIAMTTTDATSVEPVSHGTGCGGGKEQGALRPGEQAWNKSGVEGCPNPGNLKKLILESHPETGGNRIDSLPASVPASEQVLQLGSHKQSVTYPAPGMPLHANEAAQSLIL